MSRNPRARRLAFSLESLEGRQLMAAPVIGAIEGVSAPAGQISVPLLKTRIVPLTATDVDGDAVSYTVSTDRSDVSASIIHGGQYLKVSVSRQETTGTNPTFTPMGDMVFQMLPNFASQTVSKISDLVNSGFYNNLSFHRIVPNFVIQGGDPSGNGSGGPGFSFGDEFNPQAIFSGDGQLAMANSGKDTNGSQFFVTSGPQRFLDFNHSIFGQLVEGFNVFRTVNAEPNTGSPSNTPLKKIVITSASFVENTTDAVMLLKSNSGGFANVTVTANDGTPGGTSSTTFKALVEADVTNDPPILGPVTNQVTATNTPITITMSSTDLEGDPVTYEVINQDSPVHSTISVNGNKVTVTPASGYRGVIRLLAKVKQTGASSRGSSTDPFDTQAFTVTVTDQSLTATGSDFVAVAGGSVQPVLARLTSDVPFASTSYTASITWGDGTRSDGTITAVPGGSQFEIKGNKTYYRFGNYTFTVTLTEKATGLTTTTTGKAIIADAPLSAVFVMPRSLSGTGMISGQVAAFASANAGANFSDLSAVIEWGDGTSSPGTIVGANGIYGVSGTKSYSNLGQYTIKVKITNAGGSTVQTSGMVAISNRAPVFTELSPQSVTAGSPLVFEAKAVEQDPGQTLTYSLAPGGPAGATIDPVTGIFTWTPSSGPAVVPITVVATDNGSPAMSGSRTFAVDVRYVEPPVRVETSRLVRNRKAIRLQFDGTVDPSSFGPFADIALVTAGRDRKLGTRDDVASRIRNVKFDPSSNTLTLRLSQRTKKSNYRIRLNGVVDRLGREIDANGDGSPGGSFVTIHGRRGTIIS